MFAFTCITSSERGVFASAAQVCVTQVQEPSSDHQTQAKTRMGWDSCQPALSGEGGRLGAARLDQ